MEYFVAVSNGLIFGSGSSRAAAIKDAVSYGAEKSELRVYAASPSLVELVNQYGGDVQYHEMNDGGLGSDTDLADNEKRDEVVAMIVERQPIHDDCDWPDERERMLHDMALALIDNHPNVRITKRGYLNWVRKPGFANDSLSADRLWAANEMSELLSDDSYRKRLDIERRNAEYDRLSMLTAVGEALYGTRWQSQVACDLDVAVRTVQRWVSREAAVPHGVVTNDLPRICADAVKQGADKRLEEKAALLRKMASNGFDSGDNSV